MFNGNVSSAAQVKSNHCLFSCLRRTWWDGVKEDVYRERGARRNWLSQVHLQGSCVLYRVAQKTGPPYLIANILKIPRPNCVEIGELLQYYMLNTVINYLFKNFIALWRHLAKTQLLSFIHTVQIDFSITQ